MTRYHAFRSWKSLEKKLTRPGEKLLLFDFDGTLAPIVREPSRARMTPSTRNFLKKLARQKNVTVGIVSGRSLLDVKKKVGIKGLIYCGNHGLECKGPHFQYIHPLVRRFRPALSRVLKYVSTKTRNIPGTIVEDKGLTATLHYRKVAPKARTSFMKLVPLINAEIGDHGLVARKGKKSIEIRLPVDWHKGSILKWLTRKMKNPLVHYIGDDATDEDAFAQIGPSGVSVRVGKKNRSRAHYWIPSQQGIDKYLKMLLFSLRKTNGKLRLI